jgi:hypothetical protein
MQPTLRHPVFKLDLNSQNSEDSGFYVQQIQPYSLVNYSDASPRREFR